MPNSKPICAVSIRNQNYEDSLERRKIYEVIEDEEALREGQLRVVDESGEDYLFPTENFVLVELPEAVQDAVIEAA